MKIDNFENIKTTSWVDVKNFIDLKHKEAEIKEELTAITPQVTSWAEEMLSGTDDKTIELPNGDKITLVENKSWEYTPYIEEKVKELKAEAAKTQKIYQLNNPKKFTTTNSIRFSQNK